MNGASNFDIELANTLHLDPFTSENLDNLRNEKIESENNLPEKKISRYEINKEFFDNCVRRMGKVEISEWLHIINFDYNESF